MDKNIFAGFFSDDRAAVTVDWVVLTAVIVTLGIAVLAVISPALTSTAEGISSTVTAGLPAIST
ncbi:MAG: hypothetical protein L3J33_08265 [Rhodobacteraceae bacterium]|nr:hypothetical protein [Paracoccaceae bacterium]